MVDMPRIQRDFPKPPMSTWKGALIGMGGAGGIVLLLIFML